MKGETAQRRKSQRLTGGKICPMGRGRNKLTTQFWDVAVPDEDHGSIRIGHHKDGFVNWVVKKTD